MQTPISETQANEFLITSVRVSRFQYWIALVLCAVGIVIFPFAKRHGPVIIAFLPTYTTFALIANLLTAFLLLGEFFSFHLRSLAVLGMTYLFSGIIVVLYTCTFPGIYSPGGLFQAGPQTAIWLWLIWQTVFPLGIFLYTILEYKYKEQPLSKHSGMTFVVSLAVFAFLLLLLICLWTITFAHKLPKIIEGENYTDISTLGLGPVIWLVNGLACFGTFFWLRQHTVLSTWLRVAACTSLLNVLLSDYSGTRFSIGWYFSRADSALSAACLLCTLFLEVNRLYKELAHQNAELARQQQLQKSFVAVVSHEFRTALTSIEGFSELLQTQEFTTEEVMEYAGDMNHDAKRLNRMITNILDLEGMQTGGVTLSLQEIDLRAIICHIINNIRLQTTPHEFLVDLSPSLPCVQADEDKITQVFTNLIMNAVKYSPQGGTITITGKREGEMLHLIVRDQGNGIPVDQLELIFERYMRVETDHSRHITGTGLGLSIVRQIVEMHQGRVWVESILGQGSAFHVILPLL